MSWVEVEGDEEGVTVAEEGAEGESRCQFQRNTSDAVDSEDDDDDDDRDYVVYPKVLIVSINMCVLWGRIFPFRQGYGLLSVAAVLLFVTAIGVSKGAVIPPFRPPTSNAIPLSCDI